MSIGNKMQIYFCQRRRRRLGSRGHGSQGQAYSSLTSYDALLPSVALQAGNRENGYHGKNSKNPSIS